MPVSGSDRIASALSDRYAIERELGAGGMAVVYLARDLRHHRLVAIKVLRTELAAAVGHERFLQEIRLTANLQHPHILPLYDSGEAAGQLFYVMPFVAGESLRSRLAGAQMPMVDVVRILGDVAEALQYAHDHGVIHRDIKPDNVLLSGSAAVVSDFGIGKALSAARTETASIPLTLIGMSIGTPAYMAPEQAAGDPATDHRADIYAFGCMAYELLAGRVPFDAATPQRVLAGHFGEAPRLVTEFRPETPQPLAELVMRCLAKEPALRPHGAAELVETLARVSSGSGQLLLPAMLTAGPKAFGRALAIYLVSAVAVVFVARVLTQVIGLPDWLVPAAGFLVALGLPVILFTGYVQYATRRALAATPAFTPGGSPLPAGTMATLALQVAPRVTWMKTLYGGVGAVGSLAFLTASYMAMRTWGIGPAGTLVASGQLKAKPLLLIADVTVKSADSSLAGAVGEGVRANLSQSKALALFQGTELTDALRRMRLPDTRRVDLTLARQIASREGIAAIVDGELTGLGDGFLLTLRLVSADSGKVLASAQESSGEADGLIPAVDAVARKLRGRIGESLRSVRASPQLAQITTSSLEALRIYSERGVFLGQTRVQRLRRVVALDSTFATAWRSLAIAMSNARFPVSSVDTAITRAYQLRDRLPDRERFAIEGFYFGEGPGSDRQKQIEAQEALLQSGDSSAAVLNNLGMVYKSMRQWVRAESLFRAAIRGGPDGTPYYNIAVPLFAQGKLEQADSFTTAARKRSPNAGALVMNSRRALYLRGDVEGFARSLDSAKSGPVTPRWEPTLTGAWAAVAQLQGRLNAAQRGWAEVAAWDSAMRVGHIDLIDSIRSAHFDVWYRSQPARAVARLDAALVLYPWKNLAYMDRPYGNLAGVYAMAGRPDKARAILAQLTDSRDTLLIRRRQPQIHSALAEIALAERRPGDAVIEFRRADLQADGGPADQDPLRIFANLGRAFAQANEPDSAIAYFEQFIATRYWYRVVGPDPEHGKELYDPPDPIFRAVILKRLGELYELKGDAVKAGRNYRLFIELWKDADWELQVQVAEVRRRLTRLAGRESAHQP